MKKVLILLAALLLALAAHAQISPELDAYYREFPQRLGFNVHSYEFLPIHDTPAPSGFKPFYISHYGRHGSRSGSDYAFLRLKNFMQIASDEGILTPEGDSLFADAKRFVSYHNGMDGRLTPRGVREHEMLARRMYKRYRCVFRRGEVHALSSTVPRCLVSMNAFTSALKECKKDLVITWDCGEKYQRFIARSGTDTLKNQAALLVREQLESAPAIDTMAVFARYFTSPERAVEIFQKPRRLISYIYSIAQFAEAFDVDDNLYSRLPWEAVVIRSQGHVLSAYLNQCNSLELGDLRTPRACLLADEIVRKADEAIAGAPVAADLIFGHDWPFLGICSYFGLEGYGYPRLSAEEAFRSWNGSKLCPFAANLQIIFYRNRKGVVLVKFLANEQETLIPELQAYSGPYYKWDDVKGFIGKRPRL